MVGAASGLLDVTCTPPSTTVVYATPLADIPLMVGTTATTQFGGL
ncbi:hypothetical protein ABZV52_32340 [Streptomyces sp. NPDC004735]